MSRKIPPEVIEFAEQTGKFIEYWGFKNVQGKIWAFLYLSDEPLDTAELIARTGISKGLASIYIKEMLSYGVIKEAGKGPNGVVLYRAEKNQDKVIFNVLRRRERTMIAQVEAALNQCKAIPRDEKKRAGISEDGIKHAGTLIKSASTLMDLVIRGHESIEGIVRRFKSAFRKEVAHE